MSVDLTEVDRMVRSIAAEVFCDSNVEISRTKLFNALKADFEECGRALTDDECAVFVGAEHGTHPAWMLKAYKRTDALLNKELG